MNSLVSAIFNKNTLLPQNNTRNNNQTVLLFIFDKLYAVPIKIQDVTVELEQDVNYGGNV